MLRAALSVVWGLLLLVFWRVFLTHLMHELSILIWGHVWGLRSGSSSRILYSYRYWSHMITYSLRPLFISPYGCSEVVFVMMCTHLKCFSWQLITAIKASNSIICFHKYGAQIHCYSMSERISHPSTPKTTVPPWPATQAAADTSATWSAEAGFSIFSLCLEAGLRPPAGGQLLLLAAAARWRCCHDHDGGVLLLIPRSASGRQVVHRGALQKLCYTSTEFLRWEITQAGQKRGAACNKY